MRLSLHGVIKQVVEEFEVDSEVSGGLISDLEGAIIDYLDRNTTVRVEIGSETVIDFG